MGDRSRGYERVAADFAASRNPGIGVATVRAWARSLGRGSAVLDLGCGTGVPVTRALLDEGLSPFAIDASPAMVSAFRENFPGVPVACEPAESSAFFGRRFQGIIAVGLVFLLRPAEQEAIIRRAAAALERGGSLLFTAPESSCIWHDALTGLESVSLGATVYRERLAAAGLTVVAEHDDEGDNHYYESRKEPGLSRS
ncbi:MAG: methyltransferase domain-containing protein [Gemmatimonadota bacterium]